MKTTILFSISRQQQHKKNSVGLHPVWVLVIMSLSLTSIHAGYAQVVNAYAKVTSVSGKVLTVTNVNETFHAFNIGEKVIFMQMQDKHKYFKNW